MEHTNQTISIIVPTYNHRRALGRCLESIAKQTYKNYEVIIVDDGSTDGTADAVRHLQFPIFNFQFFSQENRGASAARNRGFKEAKGEYIIFCDADVVMQKDMLEKMRDALEKHPEASYAYASFKFGWKTFHLWPFDRKKLMTMPYIHSTSLIRRLHVPLKGWDESLRRFQDWDFFLTMLEEGHEGVWIPEILFTITPRQRGGISSWIPSMLYAIPWLPGVERYKQAKRIIVEKHHLSR